jgi:hypothetical protein
MHLPFHSIKIYPSHTIQGRHTRHYAVIATAFARVYTAQPTDFLESLVREQQGVCRPHAIQSQ